MSVYRGGTGQWAFYLHRVTGLGVLVFLMLHIVDTALIGFGPATYNRAMALYRHPFFKVSEVGLVAAVLYHALNGIRVMIVDFWPMGTVYQRRIWNGMMALFVVLMAITSFIMLRRI